MLKRTRRTSAIVPRSLVRTFATGMAVVPLCATGAIAVLDSGCTPMSSVACEAFAVTGSCTGAGLPASECRGASLQLLAAPSQCSGQVYVVMPASACGCSDAAAYVACTNPGTGPVAYEACVCGAPPAGLTPACATGANGLSECLIDAGYFEHADCATGPRPADAASRADVRVAVADAAFGDAPHG